MTPVNNSSVMGLVLGATLGGLAVFVAACSSSNNNLAPTVYGTDAASDSTTNVGDGAQGNQDSQEGSTTPNQDGQSPVDQAGPEDAAADSDAGASAPGCTS